ncbi:MAG: 30S ribosomal protein S6 [Desulfobacterales bacterium]
MRRYETIIILDPDLTAEERQTVLKRVQDVIEQQDGYMALIDDWGSRKLAYEIKKKERGYYVRFDFCGTAAIVDEIERFFRIDDRVLKFMTVLIDKIVDIEKIKEEVAAAEVKTDAAEKQVAPSGSETPDVQVKPSETEISEEQTKLSELETPEQQSELSETQIAEPEGNKTDTIPTESEEETK